jgi:hypothetical protein
MLLRRALTILLAAGLLMIGTVVPASAGEAGRHCETFWHLNNPNTGWGFTLCVKLEHDPNIHAWRANGSVSTSTSGMVLHTADLYFYIDQADPNHEEHASKGPAATFISLQTTWLVCGGSHQFTAWLNEWVTWPDGTNSPTKQVVVDGPGTSIWISGTC